jgi:hypothetical protein
MAMSIALRREVGTVEGFVGGDEQGSVGQVMSGVILIDLSMGGDQHDPEIPDLTNQDIGGGPAFAPAEIDQLDHQQVSPAGAAFGKSSHVETDLLDTRRAKPTLRGVGPDIGTHPLQDPLETELGLVIDRAWARPTFAAAAVAMVPIEQPMHAILASNLLPDSGIPWRSSSIVQPPWAARRRN